jgi:hypothetical protein
MSKRASFGNTKQGAQTPTSLIPRSMSSAYGLSSSERLSSSYGSSQLAGTVTALKSATRIPSSRGQDSGIAFAALNRAMAVACLPSPRPRQRPTAGHTAIAVREVAAGPACRCLSARGSRKVPLCPSILGKPSTASPIVARAAV